MQIQYSREDWFEKKAYHPQQKCAPSIWPHTWHLRNTRLPDMLVYIRDIVEDNIEHTQIFNLQSCHDMESISHISEELKESKKKPHMHNNP